MKALVMDYDIDGDILLTFNREDSLKNSLMDFNIAGHKCEVVKIDLKYSVELRKESYYI